MEFIEKEEKGKAFKKRKQRKNNSWEKVGHNREPTQQSYYWGSGWLMDYSLEKLSGCNVLMVVA